MRLKYLIVLPAFLICQFINAQMSLGIEGGINFSNIKFDGLQGVNNSTSTNYFFGVSPKYSFNHQVSVSTNINYGTKGFQLLEEGGGSNDLEYRYTYVTLSPQIEYTIHEIVEVGVGFYAGLEVDEEQKLLDGDWSSTKELDLTKSSDFGITVSTRVYLKNIYFRISYEYGLQNIANETFTDASGEIVNDAKKLNRNLQLGLGYRIDFKKSGKISRG